MSGPAKIPGNPIIEALNRATVSDANLDATEAKKIDAEWAKATPAEQQEATRFIKAKCSSAAPVCATLKDYVTHRKEVDRNAAMAAGLMGLVGKSQSGVSNMFGPGGLGTGIHDALGGIEQQDILGDVDGVGGLGTRGVGAGGGGNGLGVSDIGLYGKGRPSSKKTGNIDLGGRGKGVTRTQGTPLTEIRGGLSKDVIGRIIRRHWVQIKYAYELKLEKNPHLQGKVVSQFVINQEGKVENVKATSKTIQDAEFLKTIERIISKMQFPKPEGGGIVDVKYPFVFEVADELLDQ